MSWWMMYHAFSALVFYAVSLGLRPRLCCDGRLALIRNSDGYRVCYDWAGLVGYTQRGGWSFIGWG